MKITDIINFDKMEYNWDAIESIPEFAVLKECQQSPKWHAEGSAWIHTKAVCDAAIQYCKTKFDINDVNYSKNVKYLLTSALFHDIGKGTTTFEKNGSWHSYWHEMEGERITRFLLWDEGCEFREAICSLVRWHMRPLSILDDSNAIKKILLISKTVPSWEILLALKWCDLVGSTQPDLTNKVIDFIALNEVKQVTKSINCFDRPSTVPFKGQYEYQKVKKAANGGEPSPILDVYVLIGLPGSGKNTFIEQNEMNSYVVVSRDDIRVQLGLCSEGEKIVGTIEQENRVSEIFNAKILNAAKEGKTIVINNINLKKKDRDGYKNLLKDFAINWKYIYIEANGLGTNIARRKGQIAKYTFQTMIKGFDFPTSEEYDELNIIQS